MATAVLESTIEESAGRMRTFAEIFPPILETCEKYMRASKWYNLEKMEPGLVRLFVQQLSLWTRSGFKCRGHVYANCPHPELRMAMLEVVGEEDIEDPRVGMNHRQLMATSLGRASGQSLEELQDVKPFATTLITLDILYGIANRSWQEGIALASGMERVMQQSGYFLHDARRIQRDLGWSDEEVAWFLGHAEADVEHGAVVELLDKYISDDRDWDKVSEAIIESWIAWWIMLDGIVDAYQQGIKPLDGVTCKGLSTVF